MAFCYNCGVRIDDICRFCPECGVELQPSVSANPAAVPGTKLFGSLFDKQEQKREAVGTPFLPGYAAAYLLTNTEALSRKFGCKRQDVVRRIEQYIEMRRQGGVCFLLLDVCDYKPCQKENRHFLRSTISLSPQDGWQQHQRLLIDRYVYDTSVGSDANGDKHGVDYLFIIGGNDIIPMPLVGKHPSKLNGILSDVPYGYLYGDKTEMMITDNSLFYQAMHLMVGRLPFGDDATLDNLDTYINNVSYHTSNRLCLPFQGVYSQCDPNWMKVTACITEQFYESGLLIPPFERMGEDATFRHIRLTPPVVLNSPDPSYDTSMAFYPHASLYLFNMHGSDHPARPCYSGCGKKFCDGIHPEYFAAIEPLNLVISEACWGAKHTALRQEESILLTAMGNKTLAFIGSTHVAYGNTDDRLHQSPRLLNADIVAEVCSLGMIQGLPLGALLYFSRQKDFESNKLTPYTMTTALEFNLFGDPTLSVCMTDSEGSPLFQNDAEHATKGVTDKLGSRIAIPPSVVKMTKTTVVYDNTENSILAFTRQAVDRNLAEIRETVNNTLYAQFGIESRQLDKMLRLSYADGNDLYSCHYRQQVEDGYTVVITDAKGKIQSIATTK